MDTSTIDALAIAFTVFASLWLLMALLYMASVCIFFRMRTRGELRGSMSDPEWGRMYLYRHDRQQQQQEGHHGRDWYIPMGWLFRRYVMYQRSGEERARIAKIRVMQVEERRNAIQEILQIPPQQRQEPHDEEAPQGAIVDVDTPRPEDQEAPQDQATTTTSAAKKNNTTTTPIIVVATNDEHSSSHDDDDDDDDDDDENRCPICFARYTAERPVFDSPKCIHHFHQDCILGWLEFQSHRDCPCCRVELVSEEQIWRVVKRQRRELKRSNSSSSRGYKLNNDNDNDGGPPAIQPGTTEDEDDEEDGVDEGYDFGGISASASADLVAIRVDGGDGVELIRYDDNQPGRGLSSRGIAYTDERESLNLFAASSSNNNNSVVDSPPSGSSSPSSDDDDDDSGVIPYGMMEV